MHSSVLEWTSETLNLLDIEHRSVLEVGSYNVNGSVRSIIQALNPASYLGVDQGEGPGVDQVVNATDLVGTFGAGKFDVVISTEMMEHVVSWQPVILEMVNVLAPGGLLLITTRGPGFPYHPYPIDTWRYTVETMRDIILACGLSLREVVSDSEAPGVFAIAVKPADWAPISLGVLDGIPVEPMVASS